MKPEPDIWRNGTLRWLACAALALLPFAVKAQVKVTTLGGGPSTANPGSPAGYEDGNTLEDSQFNYPQGLALDANGNIFLADRTNGMVRLVTSPGSAATSQTSTFLTGLSQPVGVAIDAANNLYVLTYGDGYLRKYNSSAGYIGTIASGLSQPTALTRDGFGNFFVTEAIGDVKKITPGGGVTVLVAGLNAPQGIALMNNGLLAISDTLNHAIRLINPLNAGLGMQTLTGGNGVGFADGPPGLAMFNQPHGLAVAPNGALVVADRFNHRVRLVDTNGLTSTLYGQATNLWNPASYPGWFDGTVGVDPVATREPVGVTVAGDGTIFATEDFWQLLRMARGATLVNGTNAAVFVAPPSITPAYGYFPMGTTITVTSLYSTVYYTTDGSVPTTNSASLTISGGVGFLRWLNTSNDLSSLRIVAFSGTNASATVSGQSPAVTEIGLARDVVGGPGAIIYLPISVNLRSQDQIKSFAYRIEFTPLGGAPPITNIQPVNIGTNDFVPLPSVSPSGTAATYVFQRYQLGATNGVVISAVGTEANFTIKGSSVVNTISVVIPGDAVPGQSYTVTIATNSATSDGVQAELAVANMPNRTLRVAATSYLVGDTAPGIWYNAGDFNDGRLTISDVDNAFHASIGLMSPFEGSDAFDAMDAFPVDQPGLPGGDGQIRYLDWQVIEARSLGFGANWMRGWVNPGVRTNWLVNGTPTLMAISGQSNAGGRKTLDAAKGLGLASAAGQPGNVWFRQAVFGSSPPPVVTAGAACQVPLYVKVLPGYSLSGLQFRVSVVSDGLVLPARVSFLPGPGIPNPSQAATLSLGANEAAMAWSLGSLAKPLTGSNLLGYLEFTVPTNAVKSQGYSIRYSYEDGAPDLQTAYDLEAVTGVLGVGTASLTPASLTSDEWKIHFFGSVTNASAADNADPDGDGIPNWSEYLAGTDPTNPASKLVLGMGGSSAGQSAPGGLTWLSAPGKNYVIETSAQLEAPRWITISTNMVGDGTAKTFGTPAPSNGQRAFYRLRLQP